MKNLLFALLLCFAPIVVAAAPLKVVNVSAPAINCVFTTSVPCTITVNDTSDNVSMSTGGTGFFQSRTYPGAPGAPAAGLFAYEYRLDLRKAVGATAISCIDWVSISFGPVVSTLDYNGDRKPDQVFVVTGGGIGTITSPVCEGGAPRKGDSSFFWGLVSKNQAKFVTATLHEPGGATHVVKARSPQ